MTENDPHTSMWIKPNNSLALPFCPTKGNLAIFSRRQDSQVGPSSEPTRSINHLLTTSLILPSFIWHNLRCHNYLRSTPSHCEKASRCLWMQHLHLSIELFHATLIYKDHSPLCSCQQPHYHNEFGMHYYQKKVHNHLLQV